MWEVCRESCALLKAQPCSRSSRGLHAQACIGAATSAGFLSSCSPCENIGRQYVSFCSIESQYTSVLILNQHQSASLTINVIPYRLLRPIILATSIQSTRTERKPPLHPKISTCLASRVSQPCVWYRHLYPMLFQHCTTFFACSSTYLFGRPSLPIPLGRAECTHLV